ncbi:MAG: M20/M25/M40 family metallo-hydrolase [bacterium]|nr:MAG: M20/M25/M40 family metallo-hydrolase [bacterium]
MTNNYNYYKKLLNEFVSFKSISTDETFIPEINKTVDWLEKLFKSSGFKVKILKGKTTNPVVFADYKVSDKLETVLIYGHYDVQPANKADGWHKDPFTLFERNKKLLARGVVDNKGQVLIHIVTAINLIKSGGLKYNLKFLIEGNEETSNPDLPILMKKYKKDLKCNIVVVSDGELTNNKPSIEVSLRGGFNCTLTYTTGKNNLHSGIYGGGVPNAAYELSKFIGNLYNSNTSVSYNDFYKNVDRIEKSQIVNNVNLIKGGNSITKLAGVNSLLTENNYDFYTQTGLRPTIQVTGIKSGYIDNGYANIVPATAEVRLNFRIVESQTAKSVFLGFKKYVAKNTPKYIKYELTTNGFHDPIKVDTNNQYVVDVEKLLEESYKSKVGRKYVGGAIPFVGDVKKILGVDTLLISLGNEDCNMHGANENFDIDLIQKALEFSNLFLRNQ